MNDETPKPDEFGLLDPNKRLPPEEIAKMIGVKWNLPASRKPQAEQPKEQTPPLNEPEKEPQRELEAKKNIEPIPEPTLPPPPPPVNNFDDNIPEDDFWNFAGISKEEFKILVALRKNYEARNNLIVFLLGVFLTPITLAGSLLGYARSYNRFFAGKGFGPYLWPMRPITRFAMILGAIVIWVGLIALILVCVPVLIAGGSMQAFIIAYLTSNTLLSCLVFGAFKWWQRSIHSAVSEARKFGSARFARPDELYTLNNKTGFYIGQGHLFDDKGHILTVAGTRGGKGTNIIVPNLLGAGDVQTSWVVIDPKAENAIITARYQRSIGQDVIILNPWDLFGNKLDEAQSYNPLDILQLDSPHLVDDIQVIAEMIVPIESGSHDKFWTDSARTIITGLLLHLVTSQPKEQQTLSTLWEWVRLFGEDWDRLIQDMAVSDAPVNGIIVKNSAYEILKLQAAGDETFGSIITNALQATDFLKSPALQRSLQSGFDPKTLVDGKTTVYVIIPADKLRSHSRWLRLVITSTLRVVIRHPNKRVTFLLDEFAALGYLPEIETALSTYAGYNVTVWPILQSLIQLKNLYRDNWETFIANCTIRQYFTINDNFSADYISTAIGSTSHVMSKRGTDGAESVANQRLLVTTDELRRESGKKIFMFIGDLPVTYVDKLPYYLVPELNNRADKNPYI